MPRIPLVRLLAPAVLAVLALGVAVVPAAAEPGGGLCVIAGTATFTPNGPGATSTFGYQVDAALSDCQSNVAGAPTSGTVSVGQHMVQTVTIQTPEGPQQVQATYAQPLASGAGALPVNSCIAGTTEGTAVVSWPDGSRTILDYTTNAAGPAVELEGAVVPSVTLTLVSGPAGSPSTYTLTTTNPSFPVGDTAQGLVEFSSDDPAACTTAAGLSTVSIEGAVGLGHAP